MKISLMGTLVSAGVGAVDIAAEEYMPDKIHYVRVGLTAASLLANLLPTRELPYSDVAFYASLPLLEKTIRDYVKGATTASRGATTASRVTKVTLAPTVSVPAPVSSPTKASVY